MRRATGRLIAAVLLIIPAAAACDRSQPQTDTPTAAVPPAATPVNPPGDISISTAVQAKYYTDETLRGREIQVSAQNGVVTLRGSVQSEAAKQHAISLARTVEGVTRVDDELEVRDRRSTSAAPPAEDPGATGTAGRDPDRTPPAWITTKIQAQYFLDPDVKPWNIDVTTASGGVVTLEGAVDSSNSKAEALRIARETEGVSRVDDRLRVEPEARQSEPGGKTATPAIGQPDPWVTAKIQAKYFIDDDVKGRNIDVDTRSGVVTLKGTVASEAERRQAVAIARNTDGVREVTDELRVDAAAADRDRAMTERLPQVPQIDRPDPWITMKIQAKYFLDADVKGRQIDVDTRNGLVTLKGTVDTTQQKQEAEQIARETEGVKRVINQLTVRATGGV